MVIGENNPDMFASLRPLTPDERRNRFGTVTPTRTDFDCSYDNQNSSVLTRVPRWSGHAVVLYNADGMPAQIAVWGFSGD